MARGAEAEFALHSRPCDRDSKPVDISQDREACERQQDGVAFLDHEISGESNISPDETNPPSTCRVCPLMKLESAEARNTTAAAISSASA